MASAGLHDVRYDSEFPDDRTIADELLRAADQAIYRKMRGPKSAAGGLHAKTSRSTHAVCGISGMDSASAQAARCSVAPNATRLMFNRCV